MALSAGRRLPGLARGDIRLMFQFTLRDLMWLTALAGFLVHSWIERSQTVGERVMRKQMLEALVERDDACKRLQDEKTRHQATSRRAARFARMAREMHVELTEARIQAWVSSTNPNVPRSLRR